MNFFVFTIVFLPIICASDSSHPFVHFGSYQHSDDISKEYFYSGNIHASWSKAVELCELFGMNLLTFNDSKEEENFRDKFSSYFDGRDSFIFIGANTTESRSKTNWYWTNGEKLNYEIKWGESQPNQDVSNEFCLSFDEANPLVYHDMVCDDKCPFVCHEEWHLKKMKVRVSGRES